MTSTIEQNVLEILNRVKRLTAREVVPKTQEDFDRLPWLVSRQTFCAWTGLSFSDLAEEVRSGNIKVFKPKHRQQALYLKAEMARLCRLRM
jgi:hypothetical protein